MLHFQNIKYRAMNSRKCHMNYYNLKKTLKKSIYLNLNN